MHQVGYNLLVSNKRRWLIVLLHCHFQLAIVAEFLAYFWVKRLLQSENF